MKFWSWIAGAALAAGLAVTPAAAETIRLAVTDVEGMEQLQREYGGFVEELEKATGLKVELTPVNNRTAAVEAMRAEQVDFVLTGPAEYVVFAKLTEAKPVVGWHRPDYFSQLVVMAEGDIKTLADLKGKKVAFGEVGSTSQQLGPAQVLADAGLKYNVDYTAEIIKRNVAIEAMIRGDVQAVGMNLSHLRSVREKFPGQKFAVVGRGPDLPNDILIAASYVKPETIEAVRKAFLENGDALMAGVLKGEDTQKYNGGYFVAEVNDKDYDMVRAMYGTIGVPEFSKFLGE
ncbi:MAG: phosphate/phosphite/phosphonate ABC transporter substrate-binding protein [Aestuariivirga sp.]|uniref:phosphate/phosphite/phosphonate ABC transporter substrate-binding protein n=1 Tax=Aestuariivirga sp. TaxID=2650926 RepID=UPI0038D0FF40